ncbi:chemotaxis protein CheB [Sabulicella rubraurantiaca]|uniref:chemotaxis protein CheB n=1 Tax=Sabulicella rubraurantiaca TaxID=2811429 RepID=UPI001A976126|nr:chemotaxis protein CheB [Sabulicella rubraurantiaca]
MIPVLIVDDSAFMRLALRRIIEAEGDLRVVGEAADGEAAIAETKRLRPAVVAMDVEMPVLSGIEATRRIMALPDPPAVVMVSQHTSADSPAALAALAAGASDYLSKDTGLGGLDLGHLDRELRARLRHWARQRDRTGGPARPVQSVPGQRPSLILVAASTGGPDALEALLRASGPPPLPTVIAQHMPERLAPELAAHLARRTGTPVRVAEENEPLRRGEATLLRKDAVLLREGAHLALRFSPRTDGLVHPSADLLFRSAALLAVPCCAVVLTGMGDDGADGAARIASQGGMVMVQSRDSAVVGGMPSAAQARVPAAVALSPASIGERLKELVR